MCASHADASPRGMDFLLDRNRIDVALSRAQSLAIESRQPGADRDAGGESRAGGAAQRVLSAGGGGAVVRLERPASPVSGHPGRTRRTPEFAETA